MRRARKAADIGPALVWSLTALRSQINTTNTERIGPLVMPKPKEKPKPFLTKDWDTPKPKPKPTAASAFANRAVDYFVAIGIAVVVVGVGAGLVAWLSKGPSQEASKDTAPGIQYTGSVMEGLTPDQVKKLEAERDAIPVVQSVQAPPAPPKKRKSKQ
jgi:hypothetical protein